MYRFIIGDSLHIYNGMFTYNYQLHNVHTRQQQHLHLPIIRTNTAKRHITFAGPVIWNEISSDIDRRTEMSILQFKRFAKKKFICKIP